MNYTEQEKCKEYLKHTDLVCTRHDTLYLAGDDVCSWTKEGMTKYEWFAYFNDKEHIFKVVKTVLCKSYPPFEIGTFDPDIAVNFDEFKELLEKAFKQYDAALRVQANRRKQQKEKEMKAAAAKFEA